MNSKKESSKPKSSEWSFGGGWFGENETEEEQEVNVPEIKKEEKKGGGKTRRVSKFGSRRQVWNGTAEMTPGRLRKEHLIKNERGRIVSSKRHATMKQRHTSE